ncbi:PAS domain S-box protein [Methylobacterium tardum]|uniref:PAS domain S-box protein n=1 Tax=Methylobacterium tardum TaxID=374432 RepID=UPI002020D642|nr:PAS domain S-box protein [Methylobacterium tardum]URD38105.1 PAS domain S-box protein [Methylobacterium tardum]
MIDRISIPPMIEDPGRLAALDSFASLDPATEQGFEDILHLATQLCAVPVALVSLADRDRQWFKARVGFPTCETDLDRSVCKFVLDEPDILVIADLTADPRTRANPLVTGEPHIRFYAGAPLRTASGQVLGSLCVIDTEPRPEGLTGAQAEALRRLARQTMAQMELRRAVSEKDAALVSLQSREEHYRAIFESATDYAIIVMNLEGKVTKWNAGATRILGWSPDDICGKPADVFFTDEDRADGIPAREMHSALTEGRGIDERWHQRKNGERFWANGEMQALRTDDGSPIGFVKILRDRTEQRLSAERLREVDRRLAQAQEVGGVGLFSVGIADGVLHPTPEFCRLYGLPEQESYPSTAFEQLVIPEDAHLVSTAASRLSGEAPRDVEYRIRRADTGALRWIARKGELEFNGADQPTRFSGIARDVTEQRTVRDALAEGERYWRGLFEQLQEGFILGRVIRDARGHITDWRYEEVNRAWGELVGLPAQDAAGRTIRELFPGIEDAWVQEFAQVVETGRSVTFTRQVGNLNRWYEGRAHKLTDETFVVLFLEVTERVLAERAKHAADQRRATLLDLGDRLRDLDTVSEMTRSAAEIVGRALNVSRAGFGRLDLSSKSITIEQDWTSGTPISIAGQHHLEDYVTLRGELDWGEPLVIDDVETDPRTTAGSERLRAIDVGTLVNMPVRERGRSVALFFVHDRQARRWTTDEVEFLRAVADRVELSVARVRAEEQQRLLNHELSHRMKNLLAMVQSIATQTMRGATDVGTAKEVLAGRLIALGKAHDLLLGGALTSTQMEAVVRTALQVHEDKAGRFRISGPPLEISAGRALSLALMLHELATNAAKYGALSTENGHVDLHWEILTDREPSMLRLSWIELGGPPVLPPTRKGFGSRFIERGLASQVGGDLALDYRPSGVTCIVTAPLTAF